MVVAGSGQHFIVWEDHSLFAEALLEKRVGDDEGIMDGLDESDDLINKFIAICDQKIDHLSRLDPDESNMDLSESSCIPQWELERSTWQLISSLLDLRIGLSDSENTTPPKDYASDFELINYFIQNDKALAECLNVKEWLESTAPTFYPVEIKRGYWSNTSKLARDKTRVSAVSDNNSTQVLTELDPDGPIRTKLKLAADDSSYDTNLNKTIFEYHRRGKLSEAMDLCRACDQSWRAATLAGALYANDGTTGQTGGNINRELWKTVCVEMANNPSLDPHERALYGSLAGYIDQPLVVAKTWEDHVWTHFHALFEKSVSMHLLKIPRLGTSPDEIEQSPPAPILKSPFEIFDHLSRSENDEIRMAASNPFRVIQALWILGRVDSLLESVRYQLEQADESLSFLPQTLRFLVHFILVLRNVSYPIKATESADLIVKSYVELLIAAQKKNLIAIYCSYLPSNLQVECYSAFLKNIKDDKKIRYDYLRRASDLGLDIRRIALRTVELSFLDHFQSDPAPLAPKNVFITDFNDAIPRADEELIRSLEWILFDPAQKNDVIFQSNILIRQILRRGRLQTFKAIMNWLPADIIPLDYVHRTMTEARAFHNNDIEVINSLSISSRRLSAAVIEFLSYKEFFKAFGAYSKWYGVMLQKKFKESNMNSFEYKDWLKDLQEVTNRAEDSFSSLLGEGGWLKEHTWEKQDEEYLIRLEEIKNLRNIYIPEIIIRLSKLLKESSQFIPENAAKSKELTRTVKESEHGYWREFMAVGKLSLFEELFGSMK